MKVLMPEDTKDKVTFTRRELQLLCDAVKHAPWTTVSSSLSRRQRTTGNRVLQKLELILGKMTK
jgi:hypothetical protein